MSPSVIPTLVAQSSHLEDRNLSPILTGIQGVRKASAMIAACIDSARTRGAAARRAMTARESPCGET
ncbi:hypothetical protein CNY89_14425 [Amaricoccus sp. HAR-UPW-R2A-40]|nr:hypothetical protein CNY89_14425 [Amaricoccus sp. HAR-UPW-R2A-40]